MFKWFGYVVSIATDGGAACDVWKVDKVKGDNGYEDRTTKRQEKGAGVALYYLSSQTERREKSGGERDNVINYTWRRLHYHNRGTHRRGILNRILYDRAANAKNKSRPYARHLRRAEFLTNVTRTIEWHDAEREIGIAEETHFSSEWTYILSVTCHRAGLARHARVSAYLLRFSEKL